MCGGGFPLRPYSSQIKDIQTFRFILSLKSLELGRYQTSMLFCLSPVNNPIYLIIARHVSFGLSLLHQASPHDPYDSMVTSSIFFLPLVVPASDPKPTPPSLPCPACSTILYAILSRLLHYSVCGTVSFRCPPQGCFSPCDEEDHCPSPCYHPHPGHHLDDI